MLNQTLGVRIFLSILLVDINNRTLNNIYGFVKALCRSAILHHYIGAYIIARHIREELKSRHTTGNSAEHNNQNTQKSGQRDIAIDQGFLQPMPVGIFNKTLEPAGNRSLVAIDFAHQPFALLTKTEADQMGGQYQLGLNQRKHQAQDYYYTYGSGKAIETTADKNNRRKGRHGGQHADG